MDIKQITDTLDRIFREKKKRIVFWYDGEKEFDDILPSIQVDDVSFLRLDENRPLELKIKLESEDTEGKYILYSPSHEPPPEKDWLFDIRLYSYTFHADKASILLKELNLGSVGLRPYLKKRSAFFRSQERLNRLKKWINPDDREDDIDLKMLTVITRANQPEPFSVLIKLFDSYCHNEKFDDTKPSKLWTEIEKLELEPFFWKLILSRFSSLRRMEALSAWNV